MGFGCVSLYGQLVDSDESRYTVEVLKDWKECAEATAARELEQRLCRYPDSAGVIKRMERLMPALLAEMRQDLADNTLRRELVVLKRNWSYWAKGNELFYFYDDHPELDNMLLILQNEGLIQDITYNNTKRYLMSEQLAEYLGAP
jgi:hypothetical protein